MAKSMALRSKMKYNPTAPLGSGERFKSLEKSFGSKVKNPGALAASIGMKKYGKSKMMGMALAGKKGK